MQLIERWFAKTKKKSMRVVSIYEGILSKDFSTYVFFRLRYFSYTTLIRSLIFMIEFYFLLYFVAPIASLNIVLFRLMGIVITGLWWGILESLRTELRIDKKIRERAKLPIVIQHWMTLSFCIAGLLLLVGIIAFAIGFHYSRFTRLELFYLFAIMTHVATGIVVRTVHSSIFALTRISRPLLSVNLAQIIGLLFLFILYPIANQYSLAWAYIIESIIAVALTLYYTLRMDRILMLLPKIPVRWQGFLKFLSAIATLELFLSGLASLLFSIQPVFIYLLIDQGYTKLSFSMSMMIFLITPQINSTFEWTRLFYFDMKKLSQPGMQKFEQFMHDRLRGTAIYVGIGAWVISTILITYFYHENIYIATILLLPIFIVRSLNSHMEMRLFCDYRYYDVIISGLIFTAGYVFFEFFPYHFSINQNLSFVLLLFVISLIYLKTIRLKAFSKHDVPSLLSFFVWLDKVKHTSAPLCIFKVTLDKNTQDKIVTLIIKQLVQRYLVCMPRKNRLMIAVPGNDIHNAYAKIVEIAGGQVIRMHHTDTSENGQAAISSALRLGFINIKGSIKKPAELLHFFTQHFPDAQYIEILNKTSYSRVNFIHTTDQYGELYHIIQRSFKRPFDLHYFSLGFVSILLEQKNISYVFILPKQTDLAAVNDWRNKLLAYNINSILEE